MKIIEDLHVHTKFSKDSKQDPEFYIPIAIERSTEYLGFSDHLDMDPADKDFGFYNYNEAFSSFSELKRRYGKLLNLLFASELSYNSKLESSIALTLSGRPYDYVIGSVHRLEGFTISGPHGMGYFSGKDERAAYNVYFEEVLSMVQSDFFQIVGHFDVIKRYGVGIYGPFSAEKYDQIIRKILSEIIKRGLVIEINSSGFRQGVNEQYPSNSILKMYHEEGGTEITIGSDAHSVRNFGSFLEDAVKNALSVYDFEVLAFKEKEKNNLCRLSDLFTLNI